MWGLQRVIKEAFENGSPAAWGARAIWSKGLFPDLVHDRMDIYLAEESDHAATNTRKKKAFSKLLGDKLSEAWKNIPTWLEGRDDDVVVLLDDAEVTVTASPNASYGYLYIAAVQKPVQ